VTVGVVSALERTLTTLGLDKRMSYIQTDAAINVGNSGGPLLNLDGEVVGINTMTARGTQGVSFAIPIDIAKAVMQQLNKSGRVQRPYLGLRMLSLNPDVIDELRETKSVQLPASITSGALVVNVMPDSPAAKAGVKAGDIITSFDGKRVSSAQDVITSIGFEVGRSIPFEVARRVKGCVCVIHRVDDSCGGSKDSSLTLSVRLMSHRLVTGQDSCCSILSSDDQQLTYRR